MTLDDLFALASRSGCAVPGCSHEHDGGPMFLRAACHPRAGLKVSADASNRELSISCHVCGARVVTVEAGR